MHHLPTTNKQNDHFSDFQLVLRLDIVQRLAGGFVSSALRGSKSRPCLYLIGRGKEGRQDDMTSLRGDRKLSFDGMG